MAAKIDIFGKYTPDIRGNYIHDNSGKYIADNRAFDISNKKGRYEPDKKGFYEPDNRGLYEPDNRGLYKFIKVPIGNYCFCFLFKILYFIFLKLFHEPRTKYFQILKVNMLL